LCVRFRVLARKRTHKRVAQTGQSPSTDGTPSRAVHRLGPMDHRGPRASSTVCPMRDDTAIKARCNAQDDYITRAQVLDCGGTDEWIEAQIAAGRWVRDKRKVFRTTTGAPTRRQRERAALLCAGPEAALSHHSAAARFGLEPDARRAMRTLLHAALAMKVPAHRLLAVLDARRPRRYLRALRHAAQMLNDGVGSVLEARYLVDVEEAHGLPIATRQAPVVVQGVERYEDCRYGMSLGELIVRLDGWRWHSDRHVGVIDRARDNAAELAGRARLTFGWEEVVGDPCAVAALVAARLRQLGWPGPDGEHSCRCLQAA
jgi:hypothetical protein